MGKSKENMKTCENKKLNSILLPSFTAFSIVFIINHLYWAVHKGFHEIALKHFFAFAGDYCILSLIFYGIRFFFEKKSFRNIWFKTTSFFIFYLSAISLSTYPFILYEYLIHPVNIFGAGSGIAYFTLINIIGFNGLMIAIITLFTAIVFEYFNWKLILLISKKISYSLFIFVSVTIILCMNSVLVNSPWPHPVIFSTMESVSEFLMFKPRVVPIPDKPEKNLCQNFSLKLDNQNKKEKYDHILVLVLETYTHNEFLKTSFKDEIMELFPKENSVYFNNYHTNNLDSYTSLIAMLTGRHVPYRSYEAPDRFENINKTYSIAEKLSALDYHTAFLCSAIHQPFIPCRSHWKTIWQGGDISGSKKFKRIDLNRLEASYEDRSAIPEIINMMKKNSRTFIMQEMVMGHTPHWEVVTGKKSVQYYKSYYVELLSEIKKINQLDKTLIILLADHGRRENAQLIENYNVPLLISGKNINNTSEINLFLSHRDMPEIIFSYLYNLPLPKERDEQLLIGHTGRWTYGLEKKDGSYIFLDSVRGVVLKKNGNIKAEEAFGVFQQTIHNMAPYIK